MTVEVRTKAVVTVAEMARMCGLSRARFYQLTKEGVFPMPLYRIDNRRPLYTDEMQEVCLEVRRRNCGINGKPVMFYARRVETPTVAKTKKRSTTKSSKHVELIEGLQSLGLTNAKGSDVDAALKQCFPNGHDGVDEGTILRSIFLHLKRQDSADNLGR